MKMRRTTNTHAYVSLVSRSSTGVRRYHNGSAGCGGDRERCQASRSAVSSSVRSFFRAGRLTISYRELMIASTVVLAGVGCDRLPGC